MYMNKSIPKLKIQIVAQGGNKKAEFKTAGAGIQLLYKFFAPAECSQCDWEHTVNSFVFLHHLIAHSKCRGCLSQQG